MKLDEILNKPLDFKVTERSKATYIAEFTAGGRKIQFVAYNEELDYGADDDESEWVIEFSEAQADGTAAHGKTGSGNEFDVFATLKAIIQDFIGRYDPKVIAFSADKDKKNNRSRVYAKLFQKNIPAGWHLEKDETPVAHEPVFFKLVREALDRALPYDVVRSDPYDLAAKFKAGGREILFNAENLDENAWEISFAELVGGKRLNYDLTKSGSELEVFATLGRILKDFVKSHKPDEVRFAAATRGGQGNRASLYGKLVSRFFPTGWNIDRQVEDGVVYFTVLRDGAKRLEEGMMKRSDPYISGEKSGVRPPDERLAPKPRTAHKASIETLMKKSGKSREKVEAAWNKAAKEVPDGTAKWPKVMKRAKADLGVSE